MSEPDYVDAGYDLPTVVALDQLRAAMQSFAAALVALDAVGLKPSEGLRAIGVDVPAFAAPMLDSALQLPVGE